MAQSEDLQRSHLGHMFKTSCRDEFADIQFERFEFCETHQLFDSNVCDGASRKGKVFELTRKPVNEMFQSDVCEVKTTRTDD